MQGSSPRLLATWWRLAYWYGFAVQFTVLPFHQEYADSGHFTVGDRIRTAIRNNLIFYAVLVVGTASSIAASSYMPHTHTESGTNLLVVEPSAAPLSTVV